MPALLISRAELHERAAAIHAEKFADEPERVDGRFRFVAIDVESEDFEIGPTALDAIEAIRMRGEDGPLVCGILGHPESLVSANFFVRPERTLADNELLRQGRERFQEIEPLLQTEHHGEHVLIDVISGDYEVSRDDMQATEELLIRHPNAEIWHERVGFNAPYRFGSWRLVPT